MAPQLRRLIDSCIYFARTAAYKSSPSCIMVHRGGVHPAPVQRQRHHYTSINSQSYPGIFYYILTDRLCFNICRIVDLFHSYHSVCSTTLISLRLLVAPSLFASPLLYCWLHHYLQTYHKTYKNNTLPPSPILPSSLSPLSHSYPPPLPYIQVR